METVKKKDVHLIDWLREGYQNFCEATSIHGFLEMYKANSKFWVVLWMLIIAGSISIMGYQVCQAIDQYTNQIPLTQIRPAEKSEVVYPPIRFCLTHWLYWVSWTKADELNATKEVVLYGLSFMTKIFSSNQFDIEKTRNSFLTLMQKNNFTNLADFYKAIAKSVELALQINSTFNTSKLFTQVEVVNETSGLFMCYVAPTEKVIEYFLVSEVNKLNITSLTGPKNTLEMQTKLYTDLISKSRVTMEEHANYIIQWIRENQPGYTLIDGIGEDGNYVIKCNYLNAIIPSQLYINSLSSTASIGIFDDVDVFIINVKALGHVYLNTANFMCKENEVFIFGNDTCQTQCRAKNIKSLHEISANFCQKKYGVKYQLGYSMDLDIGLLPEHPRPDWIRFLTKKSRNANETSLTMCAGIEKNEEDEKMVKKLANDKIKCQDCTPGCERWSFDINIAQESVQAAIKEYGTRQYGSKLKIEYPTNGKILMMIEMEMQSWENFVGNVGGLLGIWTGASILSIIQLIYLCCFTHPAIKAKFGRKKELKNRVKTVLGFDVLKNTKF